MKKILLITKHFPPQVGGGIRRIEAVYHLLRAYEEVELEVVVGAPVPTDSYPGVKFVKQLFFKDRKGATSIIFKKSQSTITIIDKALLGWVPNVLRHIMFKKYDIVYASCPLFANAIIAFFYKVLRFNKPEIIIEYRDFYSFNPSYVENITKKVAGIIERIVLRTSNYILVTTESMKSILRRKNVKSKIFLMRNYIGRLDLEKLENKEEPALDKSFYNIGYIGKLNTGRNPARILKLLELSVDKKHVALHFIGSNDREKAVIIEQARELGMNTDRLFFVPQVDRITSLCYMRAFDGLILLVNNGVSIKDGYGIPGKLYDYMSINNNIFSDKDTYDEISIELNCIVKNRYNDFINYCIKSNKLLDDAFKEIFDKIIKV